MYCAISHTRGHIIACCCARETGTSGRSNFIRHRGKGCGDGTTRRPNGRMMGAVVVLASHAGDEILGAGAAMADAWARGARLGIIILAESDPAGMASVTAASARTRGAMDCHAALQELLGEVPPLLVLSLPRPSAGAPADPDLGENSLLGAFLHSIGAATLLVTDPGYSDSSYKAALRLGARIIAQGLAERLMVVPPGGNGRSAAAWDAQQSASPAGEIRDTLPHIIRCERADPGAFAQPPAAWWDFTASADAAAHFSRIVAALDDRWYPDILELGCGNGMLTPVLAAHSHRLVAFDASQTALDGAQMRVGGTFNVELRRGALPHDLPEGSFDLVLLNDCLCDLGQDAAAGLAQRLPLLCKAKGRIIVANRQGAAAGAAASAWLMTALEGWRRIDQGPQDCPHIQVLERG